MSLALAYCGKGNGMNKPRDEAIAGTDAFRVFAQQFGPDDVYTRIILEILLEELLSPSYNSDGGKANETYPSEQDVPSK